MKAAVFHEPNQPLTIENVEHAPLKRREVLVRTAYAGLCHSDLHFIEGLYPIATPCVLGHESSAVVEAVGSEVTYVKPGDRVITCTSVFCGTCEYCVTGRPQLCNNANVKMPPGKAQRLFWQSKPVVQFANLSSFAEQLLVHENAVVKIADDIPLNIGCLIGCGVMTGVGAALNLGAIARGDTVMVIGCGAVGQSALRGARLAGARTIIAVDIDPAKLVLAAKLGATHGLNASKDDVVAALQQPRIHLHHDILVAPDQRYLDR